jgi:hypothetical protein
VEDHFFGFYLSLTKVHKGSQGFRHLAHPNLATQSAAASAKHKPQRRRTISRLTRSFSIVKEHAGFTPHTPASISHLHAIPLFARRIKKCPTRQKLEFTQLATNHPSTKNPTAKMHKFNKPL